jgi:uncharacterized membrane protein
MPKASETQSISILAVLFELFLYACLFFYVTAGLPFINEALHDAIGKKPGFHRLSLMGIIAAGIFAYFLRLLYFKFNHQQVTITCHALNRLNFKPIFYLWSLFILISGLWTWSAWIRHDSLHTSFDMAIFVQSIWNTAQGDFLFSSIKGDICLLGDHFGPLLALIAVPYKLWPDPKLILLMQALAAASCVFPLYKITLEKYSKPGLALVIAFAFLSYLPTRNAVRFDFHPELLIMPILIWAFYFLEKQKWLTATLLLIICLSAKETVAMLFFAFGFYAFFVKRKYTWGLLWMFLASIYFFLAIKLFIPFFSGQPYQYLGSNLSGWKEEGVNAFLQYIFGKEAITYIIKIYGPLGFLSFLSPQTLLLNVPILLQNLVTRNEAVRSIFFQYTSLLTPFAFISMIYGCKRFSHTKWISFYILALSLLMSGVSEIYTMERYASQISDDTAASIRYLKRIPPVYSVRTNEFLAPHAANRKNLHIYENNHPREGGRTEALQADYIVLHEQYLTAPFEQHYADLLANGYEYDYQYKRLKSFRRV